MNDLITASRQLQMQALQLQTLFSDEESPANLLGGARISSFCMDDLITASCQPQMQALQLRIISSDEESRKGTAAPQYLKIKVIANITSSADRLMHATSVVAG